MTHCPHCGRPIHRKTTLADRVAALQSAPTPAFRNWLNWWNDLYGRALVPHGVNADRPSKAVCRAWIKAHECDELGDLLRQRTLIERRIVESDFCRRGWFRFERLLAGKNKDGEYHVRTLLDGGHRDRNDSAAPPDPNVLTSADAWKQCRTAKRWFDKLAAVEPDKWAKCLEEMNAIVRHTCECIGWRELKDDSTTRAHFLRLYSELVNKHERDSVSRGVIEVQPFRPRLITGDGETRTA